MKKQTLSFNHDAYSFREQLFVDVPTAVMIRTFVLKGSNLYGKLSEVISFVDVNMRLSPQEWTYAIFLACTIKQTPDI